MITVMEEGSASLPPDEEPLKFGEWQIIQGDTSRWSKLPVDTKTKVASRMGLILKWNFYFDVIGRFGPM